MGLASLLGVHGCGYVATKESVNGSGIIVEMDVKALQLTLGLNGLVSGELIMGVAGSVKDTGNV